MCNKDRVTSVNTDPDTDPQFNYSANTKYIRRWRIPDAKDLLEKDANGEITLPAEDKAELEAAIAQGEAVLTATIVDADAVKAAEDRLNAILAKYDLYTYPEEPSATDVFFEDALEGASKGLVEWIGGGSIVDWILSPIRSLFK